jgi:hypothetical protein
LTADNSVFPYSNANDMHVTQDLNSFEEIITHECGFFLSQNMHNHYKLFEIKTSSNITPVLGEEIFP